MTSMRIYSLRAAVLSLLLAFSLAEAHHGPGPYDRDDRVVLNNAVVTAWNYRHPHASVRVDVTDADGRTESWTVESESPNILRRVAVLPDFLSAGQVVDLHGYAHRSAPRTMKLQSVVFADGREVIVRRGAGVGMNTPGDLGAPRASESESGAEDSGGIAGIWAEGEGPDWANLNPTDEGARWLAEFDVRDDPVRRCMTPGFPRIVDQPLGLEIIEQPDQYVLLYETFHAVRRIYMDDREPTEQTIPTRMGYSKGRWEGDTLVVETTLLEPLLLTWDGHPTSGGDTTEVTERYRRVGDQLELQLTLVDPVYWAQPLTRTVSYNRAPDLEILDYGCDPAVSTNWRAPEIN